MKKLLFIFLFCLFHTGGKASTYTPEKYAEQRYQHIWTRKPFSPSNISQVIQQQYVLTGLLKMGDQWIVFVQDRKSLKRHSVSLTPNEVGLQLISVKDEGPTSTVVLRFGEQTSTIGFDPAVAKTAANSLKVSTQFSPANKSLTAPPSTIIPAVLENSPSSAMKILSPEMTTQ